jgi:TatD DNase family protein
LLDLLQKHPGPDCGFVLHSYGGPAEMIESFAKLGAYFSFPGYYAHPRKEKQRAVFLKIPGDRLLIETDAPDQIPPEDLIKHPLQDPSGRPINHPANLASIYEFAATLRDEPIEDFSRQIEKNFQKMFINWL